MIPELPWSIKTTSSKDLEAANDLGAEGWQPFAVSNGKIYFKRVGTTPERTRVPAACGVCTYFRMTRSGNDDQLAAGYCEKRKHSTNEMHYCEEFNSIYDRRDDNDS